MRSGSLVRFGRRFESSDLHGYVLSVGPKFFLLQLIDDRITYDGFECLRISDVRRFRPDPHAAFIESALRLRSPERPAAPNIDLQSIGAIVDSGSKLFPLVTIHCELDYPDECYIGRLTAIDRRAVTILPIDTNAKWEESVETYALARITRVGFDAHYENALHLVGGRPPR